MQKAPYMLGMRLENGRERRAELSDRAVFAVAARPTNRPENTTVARCAFDVSKSNGRALTICRERSRASMDFGQSCRVSLDEHSASSSASRSHATLALRRFGSNIGEVRRWDAQLHAVEIQPVLDNVTVRSHNLRKLTDFTAIKGTRLSELLQTYIALLFKVCKALSGSGDNHNFDLASYSASNFAFCFKKIRCCYDTLLLQSQMRCTDDRTQLLSYNFLNKYNAIN